MEGSTNLGEYSNQMLGGIHIYFAHINHCVVNLSKELTNGNGEGEESGWSGLSGFSHCFACLADPFFG